MVIRWRRRRPRRVPAWRVPAWRVPAWRGHARACHSAVVQRAYGLSIPRSLADLATPERLALVVYDMQVGILSQLADPGPVTARVTEALEAARAAGVRVFYTRHLSLPRELMGVA